MRVLLVPLGLAALWATVRFPSWVLPVFYAPEGAPASGNSTPPPGQAAATLQVERDDSTDDLFLKRRHAPRAWVQAEGNTPLHPGDWVLTGGFASARVTYSDGSGEVTIPPGALYEVSSSFNLMGTFPKVVYHESEQVSLMAANPIPQGPRTLARTIWLSQGKPPPLRGDPQKSAFQAKANPSPISIVRPEGHVRIETDGFPIVQEVRVDEPPALAAELLGLLFSHEAGADPIWTGSFGSSPVMDVTIHGAGEYTFLVVSEDHLRVSRTVRLSVRKKEIKE
jgi:hypothetical protein